MDQKEKLEFLGSTFVELLKNIPEDTVPSWGKMSYQHMLEHMLQAFKVANGTIKMEANISADRLIKLHAFLQSDLPFRENTKNIHLPENPLPLEFVGVLEVLDKLEENIEKFFNVFEANKDLKIVDPNFGSLSFDLWLNLLFKHGVHHLKQFNVNEEKINVNS